MDRARDELRTGLSGVYFLLLSNVRGNRIGKKEQKREREKVRQNEVGWYGNLLCAGNNPLKTSNGYMARLIRKIQTRYN